MHSLFDVLQLPDLVVGAVLVALGVTVYLARPAEPANLFFAAFMAFVGCGALTGVLYIYTTISWAETIEAAGGDPATVPGIGGFWDSLVFQQRLFWILYIFDPIALLYFASIYPRRNALHRARVIGPFVLVALVLLAVDLLTHVPLDAQVTQGTPVGPFAGAPWRHVLLAYMLAAYLLAAWALARDLAHGEHGDVTRRRTRLLLVGMSVAVFARIGLVVEELPSLTSRLGPVVVHRLVEIAVAMGSAWAFLRFAAPRSAPGAEDLAWARRWTLRLIALVALLVWLPTATIRHFQGPYDPYEPFQMFLGTLERMRFSVRWLLFGAIVAFSLLRYQLFDLSDRARRLAADALLAALLLGAFAGLTLVLTMESSPLAGGNPFLLIMTAVAASVVLVKSFDALRGGMGRRLKPPDADQVRMRKLEVYRAAAEDAFARRSGRQDLEHLQRELGLSDDEALTVQRLVDAPRVGALVPGALAGGRYLIERRLGAGGGGRVFLATDPLLGRSVVLKEVVETGPSHLMARALAEARLASGLSHPNVVTVYDTIRWGDDYLIVMEHLPGGSVEDLLQREDALPPREAVRLARGLLRGLSEVHARGIVHGDVKPGNVLLTADGEPKVADFGIAHLRRATTAALPGLSGPGGGTLRYAAPEVLEGAAPTPASDVHAAGMLLVDLLVGARSVAEPGGRIPSALARCSAPLAAAVSKAVAPDPAARFPDARAFLDALEGAPEASVSALPER